MFRVLLLFIVAIVFAYLALAFGAHIIMLNIQDIWDEGANFWNVFWILLTLSVLLGGTNKATSA